MSSEKKDNNKIEILPVLKQHPAIFFTIAYIYITLIGIIYSFVLYNRFGINIFDYAELNDFLLAAFKDLYTIGIIFSLLIYILSVKFVFYLITQKYPQNSQRVVSARKFQGFATVISFAYTLIAPIFVPMLFSEHNIKNDNKIIDIYLKNHKLNNNSHVLKEQKIIGGTEKFTFFYDSSTEETNVIPIANIAIITYKESINSDDNNELGKNSNDKGTNSIQNDSLTAPK